MKDWFDSLETREQVFVAVGAIFLLVALVYALLWMPLDKNHRQAQQSVARCNSIALAERQLDDHTPVLW